MSVKYSFGNMINRKIVDCSSERDWAQVLQNTFIEWKPTTAVIPPRQKRIRCNISEHLRRLRTPFKVALSIFSAHKFFSSHNFTSCLLWTWKRRLLSLVWERGRTHLFFFVEIHFSKWKSIFVSTSISDFPTAVCNNRQAACVCLFWWFQSFFFFASLWAKTSINVSVFAHNGPVRASCLLRIVHSLKFVRKGKREGTELKDIWLKVSRTRCWDSEEMYLRGTRMKQDLPIVDTHGENTWKRKSWLLIAVKNQKRMQNSRPRSTQNVLASPVIILLRQTPTTRISPIGLPENTIRKIDH